MILREPLLRTLRPYAISLLLGACATEPNDKLFDATYAVGYEPPQLVTATTACDRLVDHVLIGFNRLGDFDLSINVIDNCTRAGSGFSFFEMLRLGTYTRQGNVLSFTPEEGGGTVFTGLLDGEFIVLTLPPTVGGLAPIDVEFRVGPRSRP